MRTRSYPLDCTRRRPLHNVYNTIRTLNNVYITITKDNRNYLWISFRRYTPTRLWGFSGHVQTILHSLIGRVRCPWPIGGRISLVLPDRSTLTYDLYEPVGSEHEGIVNGCSLFCFNFIKKKPTWPPNVVKVYK